MEREPTARKILFFVLDLLLIIGAITSVLTIDRGRWLINNPAFYQPPEETVTAPDRASEPIPNTGAESQEVILP